MCEKRFRASVLFLFLAGFITLSYTLNAEVSDREKQELGEIASAAVQHGEWCIENNLTAAAQEAERIAGEADESAAGLKKLSGKIRETVEELDDDAPPEPPQEISREYEKRKAELFKTIGKLYIKLYRRKKKYTTDRFREYLARAVYFLADDKVAWKYAAREVQDLAGRGDNGRLTTYVPRLLTVRGVSRKNRSKVLAIEMQSLKAGLVLRKAVNHELCYYVALPKNWSDDRTWPVLVTCEGAGCNFAGNHKGFVSKRGDLPLIIVTPQIFSCTNALNPKKYEYPQSILDEYNTNRLGFDFPGLLSAMEDLRVMYNAQQKFAITGFSGGGYLTYYTTFRRPELLFGAFPCCANFLAAHISDSYPDKSGLGVPIRIFTGEKDPHRDAIHGKTKPGIEGQTDIAVEWFGKIGFTNIKRTMLEGVGHSSCINNVMNAIRSIKGVEAKKK